MEYQQQSDQEVNGIKNLLKVAKNPSTISTTRKNSPKVQNPLPTHQKLGKNSQNLTKIAKNSARPGRMA